MIKKNFWKITIITLFILLINTKVSKAAISASSKTVNSGESVSISISSNVPVLSYKVTMNSSGGLTFVTSSGGTGAGTATITDAKSTGMTSLATYTFKVPTVTTDTTYTVSFTATAMEDENFNPVANSTAIATIKVKAPVTPTNPPSNNNGSTTNSGSSSSSNNSGSSNNSSTTAKPEEPKSNDSTLKGLAIEGYELYPTFDANTREYNIRVTNDITKVTVTPTVNHSKASYKIEGATEELLVGKNVITVVVTAEDGTTSNYVINVTRDREGLNVQYIKIYYTDEEGNRQELLLNPEFSTEIFEYTLNDLSYLISKLEVEVLANLDQARIEVIGNEELVEGTNTITITVTMPSESEEEEDEVLTYKITVNKEKEPVVTLMGRIKNWFNGITGTITTWYAENQYKIIMGALMLCSACLGGLSVYLIIDYKKYRMLVKKVAEITRMNNSASRVTEAPVDLQPEQTKIEENDQEEDKIKSRGRHFE
ncbi:MAG: cadherin-like beta sandwich domain-containing protein [Clostridia bacterium]